MITQYFNTQVQEVKISKSEIHKIIIENVVLRSRLPKYDFNHEKPIIMESPCGGLILRFVQGFVLKDGSPTEVSLIPISKYELTKNQ